MQFRSVAFLVNTSGDRILPLGVALTRSWKFDGFCRTNPAPGNIPGGAAASGHGVLACMGQQRKCTVWCRLVQFELIIVEVTSKSSFINLSIFIIFRWPCWSTVLLARGSRVSDLLPLMERRLLEKIKSAVADGVGFLSDDLIL